jgi:hypothetical protein
LTIFAVATAVAELLQTAMESGADEPLMEMSNRTESPTAMVGVAGDTVTIGVSTVTTLSGASSPQPAVKIPSAATVYAAHVRATELVTERE